MSKASAARWRQTHPWSRYVEYARRRCDPYSDRKEWKSYREKGIRCHLTAAQLEEIWFRDGAAGMKRPSLDRRDPRFDYANWNVRFIEFNLNSRLAWDPEAEARAAAEVANMPYFT